MVQIEHSAPKETAVLLIAHGSRRPSANEDLFRLAELVFERGSAKIVETAFLELAEPTIAQGAAACVRRGARRVLMLPYFLSAGEHVTRDLQRFREELSRVHGGVEFVVCPPLGLHPGLVDAVLDRIREGTP
jgi:sirohydrochlorin ferrochelatase